jgi:hypothetical protein
MARTKITRAQQATITKVRDLQCLGGSAAQGVYADATDTNLFFSFTVPDDYVSGDLTVTFWLRGATTGNVQMYRGVWRHRQGVAESVIDAYPTFMTIAMGTGSIQATFAVLAANFQAGDCIRIGLNRDGSNAADTSTGSQTLDRMTVSYSGTP